jgi:hypothetical protein
LVQVESAGSAESLSGLTPNTTYYLFLNACNAHGCTDFAFLGNSVTQANVPGLAVIQVRGNDVQLNIDPKGNPAGTLYRTEARTASGNFIQKSVGTTLSSLIGGLIPGKKYTFRVFALNHAGLATDPSNEENAALPPDTIDGARAYPVPFRPGLGVEGITFDRLPEETAIRIFTVDGRPVKTLVTKPGRDTLWDLTNNDGNPVASGVYLAIIEKDGGRKRLKIVVQK